MLVGINHVVELQRITPSAFSMFLAAGDSGPEWWSRGRAVFTQRWMKARMSQLMEGYRESRDGGKETRVVDGVFRLGEDYAIFLTVRLRRAASGKRVPAYSVARYATQPPSGVFPSL
jgi:hypothetical protein